MSANSSSSPVFLSIAQYNLKGKQGSNNKVCESKGDSLFAGEPKVCENNTGGAQSNQQNPLQQAFSQAMTKAVQDQLSKSFQNQMTKAVKDGLNNLLNPKGSKDSEQSKGKDNPFNKLIQQLLGGSKENKGSKSKDNNNPLEQFFNQIFGSKDNKKGKDNKNDPMANIAKSVVDQMFGGQKGSNGSKNNNNSTDNNPFNKFIKGVSKSVVDSLLNPQPAK